MDVDSLSEEQRIIYQQFGNLSQQEQTQLLSALQPTQQQQQYPQACDNIVDQLPDDIDEYLMDHQKETIELLYDRIIEPPNGFYNTDGGKGVIVAHNMGLGKTTTTVAFLYGILNEPAIKKRNFKILIVSPVNVIAHWMDEFKKEIWGDFFQEEAIVRQLVPQRSSNRDDPHSIREMQIGNWSEGIRNDTILIVGYEIYDKMLSDNQNDKTMKLLKIYLQSRGPDIVIFDEGHRLKNDKTLSYRTKMEIRTKRRILLTGTPLENGPTELYHVVEMAEPGFLGTKNSFDINYGWKIERGKFVDASEEDKRIARETEVKLYEKLKELMNRKDAEYLHKIINVNKKEITITFCETAEQKELMDEVEREYENAQPGLKTFLSYFYNLLYITSHPVIAELKQGESASERDLANCSLESKDPKRSNKMLFLFDIIKACDEIDEKLVIFTQCLPTLDYIEHQLLADEWRKGVDFFRVDGKTDPEQRASYFKEFNNEENREARLFLLSIKAGSVGINLIGANRMVLFDHCFNPVHNTQATYRIYRIGQKRDVFIYRFVTKNSSDDRVMNRQITKEQQSKRTIDGKKKIAPKYTKQDIKIRRGFEDCKIITNGRIKELKNEFDDELLIDKVKKYKDGIIDVSDHAENFDETVELPYDREIEEMKGEPVS